ncbi:hypothetical protein AK95_05495 [Paenibacillus sp. LC231]|uniref:hypothetical protein n=1 Tax=Paenibacillus sp. LC231 TaxID=1120679 RepID=UPI0008DE14BE|nr:hypothetical protein [Paenibacillus sp. LC231]OIB03162.1 hypothetical protein AK95_05495 [Paenibacillus sp. LC231]
MRYRTVFYATIAIVLFFVMVSVLGNLVEGSEAGAIQLSIEWLTKYVLPWIFLYWFIKLVRKIK